jgi:hypothetical protein
MDIRPHPLVAAGLAAAAAACTLLPWWRALRAPVLLVDGPPLPLAADEWTGAEILGTLLTVGIGTLAVAAVALAVVGRLGDRREGAVVGDQTPRTALSKRSSAAVSAAVGAAVAAGAVRVLFEWGPSGALGAWFGGLLGLLAVAVALRCGRAAGGRRRVATPAAVPAHDLGPFVLAAALVGGLVVGILPAAGATPAAADGPFTHIADLATVPLRSGATALPASDLRLTTVDGAVAAVTDDGIADVEHGRVTVLARVGADDRGRHAGGILGVADGRVARFVDASTVLVTGLHAGDPTAVRINGVAEAGTVGSDGTAWLRGYGEPSATIRRLDLSSYTGAATLDITFLPVVTIDAPVGADPVAVHDVVPVQGGALRRAGHDGGFRLERIAAEPGRVAVTPVAGGFDPTCGLTAAARSASLPTLGPFAGAPDGGAWLAAGGRLLRVGPDGVLRAVRAPPPGEVSALVTTAEGSVVLAVRDALWTVSPTTPLDDLPPTPSDCVPQPRSAGPAVALVPVANTGTDRLGAPLGVDGRWVGSTRDGQLTAVSADGRTRRPLGTRADGAPGAVWPDGSGGVWWLESAAGTVTLVHGRPGLAPVRLPPVAIPADRVVLVPDLGGRTPLVATPTGAFEVDAGVATRVVDGPVTGGVVRADGHGWLLAGGRLLALDGGRVLGAAIDGSGIAGRAGVGAPVPVQLAKNVPPARIALDGGSVALDARGRAAVFSDGVVLAVTVDGTVTPVAQDLRLTAPVSVEGGLVQRGDDGALLRVDLPG